MYPILFCIIVAFCSTELSAVTLVYNLRVRRIFNVPEIADRLASSIVLSAVPIYFQRTADIESRSGGIVCEKRRAGGALLNLRYVPSARGWVEVTSGIERDSGEFSGIDRFDAARTGMDDIVFSGGYRHFIKNW